MNKELEAFEEMYNWIYCNCETTYEDDVKLDKIRKIVKQALQRLEQIDNAKSNEIMKSLERIREFLLHRTKEMSFQDLRDIEQALLKAQEDKAEIERLKQENTILHIELATFEKLMFKKYKGE